VVLAAATAAGLSLSLLSSGAAAAAETAAADVGATAALTAKKIPHSERRTPVAKVLRQASFI